MTVVRDTASVTVSEPVPGDARRKSPSRGSATNTRRARNTTLDLSDVNPAVRKAALAARRPGERIHVISATEVEIR